MLRLRLVVGKVVRSLGCGGGYTSSTRQRGVSIMGEFMSTIQYNTIAKRGQLFKQYTKFINAFQSY